VGKSLIGMARYIALCVALLGCGCTQSSVRPIDSVSEQFRNAEPEAMPFPKEGELRELQVRGPFSGWEWKVVRRVTAVRVIQLLRENMPFEVSENHGVMVNPAPPAFTIRISSDRFETYEVGFDPLGGKIYYWFEFENDGWWNVREFKLTREANVSELASLLKE